jgi:hypothetical protein
MLSLFENFTPPASGDIRSQSQSSKVYAAFNHPEHRTVDSNPAWCMDMFMRLYMVVLTASVV